MPWDWSTQVSSSTEELGKDKRMSDDSEEQERTRPETLCCCFVFIYETVIIEGISICYLFFHRLLLTQYDCTLEDHTGEFLDLAYKTHYPDSGLNDNVKLVPLSPYGPQGKFKEFVELVLAKSGSLSTVG